MKLEDVGREMDQATDLWMETQTVATKALKARIETIITKVRDSGDVPVQLAADVIMQKLTTTMVATQDMTTEVMRS